MKKKLLYVIITLILFIAGTTAILLYTPTGIYIIYKTAQIQLPGKLEFKTLRGSIINGIKIKQINYAYKNNNLTANNIILKFNYVNYYNILTKIKSDNIIYHYPKFIKPIKFHKNNININWEFIKNNLNINANNLAQNLNINLDILNNKKIVIKKFLIQNLQDNYFNLSGDIIKQNNNQYLFNLSWKANSQSLNQLSTDLYGELSNTGIIKNNIINADLNLINFRYTPANIYINNLQSKIYNNIINFKINNLKFKQQQFGNININANIKNIKNIKNINSTINNLEIIMPYGIINCQGSINTKLNNSLSSTFDLNILNGILLSGDINHNFNTHNYKLNLNATSNNINILNKILPPDLTNINGKFNLNLSVNINSKAPTNYNIKHAKLNWYKGELLLPSQGLKINNINLDIHSKNNLLNWQATANTANNNGTININATTNLKNKLLATNLKLLGQNILLRNTNTLYLEISPIIKANIDLKQLHFNAKVNINKANIRPNSSQSYSNDVVLITHKQQEKKISTSPKYKIFGNIITNLGDNTYFSMAKFTSKIIGSLSIDYNNLANTVANGALELKNANYSIYDQILPINKGTLTYINAPLDNPIVNISGEKKISAHSLDNLDSIEDQDITVGVSLTGPLNNAKIDLFSKPAMSQADILSYLLFGVKSNDLDKSKLPILLHTTNSFFTNNKLTDGTRKIISSLLKLDEISIDTQTNQSPSGETQNQSMLFLGKQITRDIFIRYGFGLSEPLNKLQAIYQFTPNWKIEADYNTFGQGSGDLIYSKEYD